MSALYYPYWRQDHSYMQMDATTPVQHFWVNNADKNFVVTYIANTRAARVKCRICGMVWVRNSIIMLNVIYAEWFKEINSTVKRARHSRPENGACSTGLKTPISVLVSISTCRCLSSLLSYWGPLQTKDNENTRARCDRLSVSCRKSHNCGFSLPQFNL